MRMVTLAVGNQLLLVAGRHVAMRIQRHCLLLPGIFASVGCGLLRPDGLQWHTNFIESLS
jgi:hypothetical protein